MKYFLFYFALVLTFFTFTLGSEEDTLTKLQVIFRHGYRYPISLGWTENDSCAETYKNDKEKLGNLTNLGKSQMTLLGYFLRIHYNNFIGADPKNVQVYYSDCYRDQESANLMYKALFPNFNDKSGLKPEILNKTIEGTMAEDANDTIYDGWLKDLPFRFKEKCEWLDNQNLTSCKNRSDFQNIVDQMVCEQAEECVLPNWLDEDLRGKLDQDNDDLYGSFQLCKSKDFIHGNSDNMLQWMNDVFVIEKANTTRNVSLYASHDTNIAIILTRLGVFNSRPVPFGAALAFEQHTVNGKPIIRIYYDNSTDYSNFHILKLPNCELDCPYEQFVKIIQQEYHCVDGEAPVKPTDTAGSFATRPEAVGLVAMALLFTTLL